MFISIIQQPDQATAYAEIDRPAVGDNPIMTLQESKRLNVI